MALAMLVAVQALTGCGVYSSSSGRVDESIQKVAVQYLENLTSEPNIGVDVTDLIVQALQLDNTLKIGREGESDSIISGQVTRFNRRPVATRQDLTVDEYQVQIAVKLTFTVRATGETIFKDKRFTGVGNYVLEPIEETDPDEEDARNAAVEEIIRDILALVVEEW